MWNAVQTNVPKKVAITLNSNGERDRRLLHGLFDDYQSPKRHNKKKNTTAIYKNERGNWA